MRTSVTSPRPNNADGGQEGTFYSRSSSLTNSHYTDVLHCFTVAAIDPTRGQKMLFAGGRGVGGCKKLTKKNSGKKLLSDLCLQSRGAEWDNVRVYNDHLVKLVLCNRSLKLSFSSS